MGGQTRKIWYNTYHRTTVSDAELTDWDGTAVPSGPSGRERLLPLTDWRYYRVTIQ